MQLSEDKLIEKLRLVEALFAGAGTEGERGAADHARLRILERLKQWDREDPPIEFRFSMGDMWSRKVFVALLRRYGVQPYRYSGQRYTTVMAKVSKRFVDETLWPEFQQFSETLRSYLSDVTDRVVKQVIHQDSSEAEVVDKPEQLASPATDHHPAECAPSVAQAASPTPGAPVDATDKVKSNRNRDKRRRNKRNKRKRR